jgi:signal transduction histidine kinase
MGQLHALFKPGETFAAKIFVAIIALVLVLSFSFTVFFIHTQWQSRSEILVRQGEVLARFLAHTSRLGVFAENPDLVKDPVYGVLQNTEVVRVALFSASGKLLLEKNKDAGGSRAPIGRLDGKLSRELSGSLRKAGRIIVREGATDTLEFWSPVLSDPSVVADEALFFSDSLLQPAERTIGFVQVVLDKKVLSSALMSILLKSSLIALTFLFVAMLVVFFVVKGITGPLNRLTERVRGMGGNVPLAKVIVETHDEIGKLAAAFNDMTECLQARETEKSHLESQLRQAHKMEAIGTLAGGIAHDFNNILSTIEGYAVLLRESIRKKSQARSYVDQIAAAAERASDLTTRLLAFSKNQIINPAPIDLNVTIRRINPLLDRFVGERIELHIRTTTEELVVMADELQIEQTLINIVTNARDAMPLGGVLAIATELVDVGIAAEEEHRDLPPGTYARLTVSDSGQGIDPCVRERIFDPFFTTKEVGKGTGLGLSMAYGIVKQHNGHIFVDNASGHGAIFSVYLPLVESAVERKKLASVLMPTGNRETILLAEDDRFVRMLTKHILTKYGYHVIEAVDGEDAIAKFRENIDTINLLLCDVIMPKKNGKQVYDEVRRLRPDIRCVFMTGHPYDVISDQGLTTEDLVVITKPLTPGELLMGIRDVLAGDKASYCVGAGHGRNNGATEVARRD